MPSQGGEGGNASERKKMKHHASCFRGQRTHTDPLLIGLRSCTHAAQGCILDSLARRMSSLECQKTLQCASVICAPQEWRCRAGIVVQAKSVYRSDQDRRLSVEIKHKLVNNLGSYDTLRPRPVSLFRYIKIPIFTIGILMYYRSYGQEPGTPRSFPRRSRNHDPAVAALETDARLLTRKTHQTGFGESVAGGRRFSLSGAPKNAQGGLARSRSRNLGERATNAGLPPYRCWYPASRRGSNQLRKNVRRYHPRTRRC
jgi:hypothetical protein